MHYMQTSWLSSILRLNKFKRMSFVVIAMSWLLLAGCQRAQDDKTSKIDLQIPEASVFKKLTSDSLSKTDNAASNATIDFENLCFAVQVSASDITYEPKSKCDFRKGMVVGSVPAGGTLSLDVSRGSDRIFEVYGYLKKSSADTCGSVPEIIPDADLSRIYLLGKSDPQSIQQPEVSVSIDIKLPSSDQNVISQFSLPPSCVVASDDSTDTDPTNPKKSMTSALELKSSQFLVRGNFLHSKSNEQSSSQFKVKSKLQYSTQNAWQSQNGFQVRTLGN